MYVPDKSVGESNFLGRLLDVLCNARSLLDLTKIVLPPNVFHFDRFVHLGNEKVRETLVTRRKLGQGERVRPPVEDVSDYRDRVDQEKDGINWGLTHHRSLLTLRT